MPTGKSLKYLCMLVYGINRLENEINSLTVRSCYNFRFVRQRSKLSKFNREHGSIRFFAFYLAVTLIRVIIFIHVCGTEATGTA